VDDYHLITRPAIQAVLQFLLTHQPANLHLVLVSRADPPWPLGRLRARREMNEIRAADLRFTPQEAAEFLNKSMGLGLTPEQVAALETRTEGWVAGLQLAALSLQGQANPQEIIASLAGSHRFIADYLVEEVLEKQTPIIQEFLLQTSILSQMNAALCEAVTGQSDSQALLLRLEQSNLFLLPLDQERNWYRYHHLFADLLRARLTQSRPSELPGLYRRASQALAQQGRLTEAIDLALVGGDFEQALDLLEQHAFTILDGGEFTLLLAWLAALPPALLHPRPWMNIIYAWALVYTNQPNRAENFLAQAEALLADPNQAETPRLRGYLAAIRVLVAKNRGEMPQVLALAEQALAALPPDDAPLHYSIAQTQAMAYEFIGHWQLAKQAYQAALEYSQATQDPQKIILALCELAGFHWLRGQLRAAETTCQQALALSEQNQRAGGANSLGAGLAYAWLSRVLVERNEVAAAAYYAEQGLALSQRYGQADVLFMCQVALAEQFETQYLLSEGDLNAAERWLQKLGWQVGDEIPRGQGIAFEFVSQILLKQGNYTAALQVLQTLETWDEIQGSLILSLPVKISQVMAWQALGNTARALETLAEAVRLAEPEGFIRVFLDRGEPMRTLLRKTTVHPAFVARLLAAFDAENPRPAPAPAHEPFSERELEILRLLATNLDAPEMAEKLVLSANTVRTHIKSLYRKLNAHSRHEALAQAKELRLV